ncbi:MAG: alpha/beta hydrolase [Phycisphaerales bacterium]|nr:MAG: alpha/beta hydrolase [Phycisphaerales bacterium]
MRRATGTLCGGPSSDCRVIASGLCILALSTFTGVVGCAERREPFPVSAQETVVLLHGLGRTSASMSKLHRRLEQGGYRVKDWAYRSTRGHIEDHGQRLHDSLVTMNSDPNVSRIHIVSHSLGGIVARYALMVEVPEKMGRVVMLAPPNRGSAAARKLAPLLGKVIKPLEQLSDDPTSDVNQLAVPADVEFGVIAAAADGKVRPEDTHLPGEADHLIVPGFHTFIMNRDDVGDAVLAFLERGRFRKPTAERQP